MQNRSLRAARTYRLLLGCVLATITLVSIVDRAFAAEVSSTGTSDRVRCSTAAATLAAGTNSIVAKCYVELSGGAVFSPGSSTIAGVSGNAFQVPYRVAAGASGTTPTTSACSGGTMYTGPMTVPLVGEIPVGALVFVGGSCTLGALSGTPANNLTGMPSFGPRPLVSSVHCDTPSDAQCVSATGSTWGYDWHAVSTLEDLPWPADWFPSGDEFSSLSEFCGASVVTDPSPPAVIREGDSIEFTTTGTAGVTDGVWVEWRTDVWTEVRAPSMIGTQVRTLTVPALSTGWVAPARSLSDVRLRCRSLNGGFRYLNVGEVDTEATDVQIRPCALAFLTRNGPNTVEAGESYSFSVRYTGTGTAETIDVQWATFDPQYTAQFQDPAWTGTFTTPPAWTDIPLGTYAATVNLTAPFSGSARQFVFRCEDSFGYYSAASFKAPLEQLASGTIGDDDCTDQDWGALPTEWVPAAGRMGGCIAIDLWVPDTAYFIDTFGDTELTEATFDDTSVFYPITLLGATLTDMADMVIVSDSQVASGSCSISLPFGLPSADGQSIGGGAEVLGLTGFTSNTCSGSLSRLVSMARYLSLVAAVFGFLFWLYRWASRLSTGNSAT